ncbi:MAG: hypothetical protein RR527_02205 [Clostridia bacterium]
MNDNSRTSNLMRNTAVGLAGQLLTYLFAFAYRTVFITVLSKEYLGVSGLLNNILLLLSVAEIGIGSAITLSLYKPLAEHNEAQIRGLMAYYAKAYRIIGLFVGIAGASLTPFLNFFIAEQPNIPQFKLIYLLYVLNTALSYFFVYQHSVLQADQRGYMVTIRLNLFTLLRTVFQIAWLLTFRTFLPTLIIQIVFSTLGNLMISKRVYALYPYLKGGGKAQLHPDEKKEIGKKIRAMFFHKIGLVAVCGTDNLLLSKFVGLWSVALYSNYLLLIDMINAVITQFTSALIPGVGNLTATESKETSKQIFDTLNFMNYWITSFCTVCFITLFNPFITVWIGTQYLFGMDVVCCIVGSYYLTGMRRTIIAFRDALGLFQIDRYKPIFEAVIKLVVSILLLQRFGVAGVFMGTIISTLTTSFWVEPYVLFHHYFKDGLGAFWRDYILRTLVMCLSIWIMHKISLVLFDGSLVRLIALFAVSAVVPNLILILFFWKTAPFEDCLERIRIRFNRKA